VKRRPVSPCKECPFRRRSLPGYVGASTPTEFISTTQADVAMPCHMSVDWVGKGDMGWFGVSRDKVADQDWNNKFWDMIESLPPDTMITVVDCHI